MNEFQNKVAVVTGAASGIGRALAEELARRGCRLVLADVNERGLDQIEAELRAQGTQCMVVSLDVRDKDAVAALAPRVIQRFGTVNLLFNNAGVTLIDSVEQMSCEDVEWVMGINFWGVVYCTKAFLPAMLESGNAHIVNVSSLFGICASRLQAAYCASKFAVRGFTEALEMELDGSGVHVTCVHPGGIKTSITDNSRFGGFAARLSRDDLNREFDKMAKTTPEAAALKILKGVSKRKRRVLIGPDARVGDWIARLFPSRYERLLGLQRGLESGLLRSERTNG